MAQYGHYESRVVRERYNLGIGRGNRYTMLLKRMDDQSGSYARLCNVGFMKIKATGPAEVLIVSKFEIEEGGVIQYTENDLTATLVDGYYIITLPGIPEGYCQYLPQYYEVKYNFTFSDFDIVPEQCDVYIDYLNINPTVVPFRLLEAIIADHHMTHPLPRPQHPIRTLCSKLDINKCSFM